jgi:uncharacterized HAD superfamily protein
MSKGIVMNNTITFDIDDCLVDTNGASERIAAKHGETLDYSDFHYIKRCSPECAKEISDFLFVGDASCNPKLVELTSNRVPEYMRRLDTEYKIYYVTARASDMFEPTLRYFEHYGIPVSRDTLITLGPNTNKIDVLKKLDTIFHLDDSVGTIQNCMIHNINFCMLSGPQTAYNKHLRQIVGRRWVKHIDEFWTRRAEFIPGIKR